MCHYHPEKVGPWGTQWVEMTRVTFKALEVIRTTAQLGWKGKGGRQSPGKTRCHRRGSLNQDLRETELAWRTKCHLGHLPAQEVTRLMATPQVARTGTGDRNHVPKYSLCLCAGGIEWRPGAAMAERYRLEAFPGVLVRIGPVHSRLAGAS